jgi:hypothetical protein
MESRPPISSSQLKEFYGPIAPIIESSTGVEAVGVVREWSAKLMADIGSEVEVLMLIHGQGVSDRFMYGFCSAIVAMKHENGDELPDLPDDLYDERREEQDFLHVEDSLEADSLFGELNAGFHERFPLTYALIINLEHDLRTRLQVPEEDIQVGFNPGWYKALCVVMPTFTE